MKILIEIETGNAAFTDNRDNEVYRILNKYINRIHREGICDARLMDINGNHCGDVVIK